MVPCALDDHRLSLSSQELVLSNGRERRQPRNCLTTFSMSRKTFSAELRPLEEHDIPSCMVVNLDETALPITPVSQWTLAERGSKQIPITGLDDKRQLTAVVACTLEGDWLPLQLLYKGTADRCHPQGVTFPVAWDISTLSPTGATLNPWHTLCRQSSGHGQKGTRSGTTYLQTRKHFTS